MLSKIHNGNDRAKLIHRPIRLCPAQAGCSGSDNPGTRGAAGTCCDITAAKIISAEVQQRLFKFIKGGNIGNVLPSGIPHRYSPKGESFFPQQKEKTMTLSVHQPSLTTRKAG